MMCRGLMADSIQRPGMFVQWIGWMTGWLGMMLLSGCEAPSPANVLRLNTGSNGDIVALAFARRPNALIFLDHRGLVGAIDLQSRKPRWSYGRGSLDPLEFEGTLLRVVATSSGDKVLALARNEVFALGAFDGKMLWKWGAGNRYISAGPAVAGDLAVIQRSLGDRDKSGAEVVCLDLNRGEPAWTQRISEKVGWGLAATSDAVYAMGGDGQLTALDMNDGRPLWRVKVGDVASDPVVVDGQIYLATRDGMMLCLDCRTGGIVWRKKITGWNSGAQGILCLASTGRGIACGGWRHGLGGEGAKGFVAGVSRDGMLTWLTGNESPFVSKDPFIVADMSHYYSVGANGLIRVISESTGEVEAVVAVPAPVTGSAAIGGGCFFVGAADGNVFAINKQKWRLGVSVPPTPQ